MRPHLPHLSERVETILTTLLLTDLRPHLPHLSARVETTLTTLFLIERSQTTCRQYPKLSISYFVCWLPQHHYFCVGLLLSSLCDTPLFLPTTTILYSSILMSPYQYLLQPFSILIKGILHKKKNYFMSKGSTFYA